MKLYKRITGYQPSNKDDILGLITRSSIFNSHSVLENEGVSTFEKYGKLHTQYPKIFDEFCKFLLSGLGGGYSIMDMWANICPLNSFVKPHHHYNALYPNALAGVYYLKKPDNSGSLVIENEEIEIAENDLVLFEGKKLHWTHPNKFDGDRIALSFNLVQKL